MLFRSAGVAADGGVFGLENIIDPTQNYANINVSTYPNWVSYVNGNSGVGRALTQDLLLQMEVIILRNGGTFTAIYTTPELVAKYKKLFTTTVYQVSQLGKTPDLGYTGVEYAGRPIIADPYCPNGQMFFINEEDLAVYTFAQEDTSDKQGIQVSIEEIPQANPDALYYALITKAQLKVHNRKKSVAALVDLTQ